MAAFQNGGVEKPATAGYVNKRRMGCLIACLLFCVCLVAWVSDALNEPKRRREEMQEEIAKIKSGAQDCLVCPEAEFLELVMSDPECMKKIREVILSNDVWGPPPMGSEPHLAQLRKLPNLIEVSLVKVPHGDAFLKNIRGMKSVETVVVYGSGVTSEGIQYIAEMPNLRFLSLCCCEITPEAVETLKGMSGLEYLNIPWANPEQIEEFRRALPNTKLSAQ